MIEIDIPDFGILRLEHLVLDYNGTLALDGLLPPGKQDEAKAELVRKLGPDLTAAMGNGRNDGLMLRQAALGFAVLGPEGAAGETLLCADVVCPGILAALELLENPLRLKATLRR